MGRTWAVSFGETERMDLERIVMDSDTGSALEFLKKVIYPSSSTSRRCSTRRSPVSLRGHGYSRVRQ